jgi:hypothetical protein
MDNQKMEDHVNSSALAPKYAHLHSLISGYFFKGTATLHLVPKDYDDIKFT